MLQNKRIYVAGHGGLVGSAICRRLQNEECEVLTATRAELDLCNQSAVKNWMQNQRPDIVIIAAAKVGGIKANMNTPADFLADNLQIQTNIIQAAHQIKVKKLLFLGSSCIYPKNVPQPIVESALLTGELEPTNAAYAIAKIAGLQLCRSHRQQYGHDFISAMPCNLYGPNDCFDLENSHVIPALMMKIHAAKQAGNMSVEIWGSGTPRREFLHVDDCADALIHVLKNYSANEPINIGAGADITIKTLAEAICTVVGFDGALTFNTAEPDGVKAKLMDDTKLKALGWKPSISLKNGLEQAYEWYKNHAV